MPKEYPSNFKKEVIQRHEDGESLNELSRELHIALSTLYHWRKAYYFIQTPNRTYTPKEFDALMRRLQKAEHELEIIRLTGYLANVPLQEKLAALEQIYNRPEYNYSVYELCEALDVSRGTFYNHIFRRADRRKYENEQAQLMLKVRQIFDDSNQCYGAEKIRVVLAESGIRVSAKRISSIMRELDLHSVRPDAKKLYRKQQQRKKENLLKRSFSADHPNQIWVSDITYCKVKGNWLYLCVILDLYSRRVIGYRISQSANTRIITAAFRNTYAERGSPSGLTFHSDRGAAYVSKTFTELLKQCSVKQSFSASGRPLDNAVSEAFFATLKKEEVYRKDYTSERHFRCCVDAYIRFYNEVRPHQTLNYKTPAAFEADFFEKKCSSD